MITVPDAPYVGVEQLYSHYSQLSLIYVSLTGKAVSYLISITIVS